jgi:hypothetical protein
LRTLSLMLPKRGGFNRNKLGSLARGDGQLDRSERCSEPCAAAPPVLSSFRRAELIRCCDQSTVHWQRGEAHSWIQCFGLGASVVM